MTTAIRKPAVGKKPAAAKPSAKRPTAKKRPGWVGTGVGLGRVKPGVDLTRPTFPVGKHL